MNSDLVRMCSSKDEIVDSIKHNKNFKTNITHLDLRWSKFGYVGMTTICESLKLNDTITTLNLSGIKFGDDNNDVYNVLKTNKTITTLDLSYNDIGYNGLRFLCESIQLNDTLTCLNIDRMKGKEK
eukprot:TRINITY_DN3699_c0_g1_i2.p1 TRINITY_DN3699_c0_g1~~TRINITY_DN3699_c0_g1_i2.p1  ORF type:complete len:126 (+),score=16.46 TRINITY_DN3699_c0_g1_i2:207-584(+)